MTNIMIGTSAAFPNFHPLFMKQSLPIRGYAAGWAGHGLI